MEIGQEQYVQEPPPPAVALQMAPGRSMHPPPPPKPVVTMPLAPSSQPADVPPPPEPIRALGKKSSNKMPPAPPLSVQRAGVYCRVPTPPSNKWRCFVLSFLSCKELCCEHTQVIQCQWTRWLDANVGDAIFELLAIICLWSVCVHGMSVDPCVCRSLGRRMTRSSMDLFASLKPHVTLGFEHPCVPTPYRARCDLARGSCSVCGPCSAHENVVPGVCVRSDWPICDSVCDQGVVNGSGHLLDNVCDWPRSYRARMFHDQPYWATQLLGGGKFSATKAGTRSGAQRRWELARAEVALEHQKDTSSVDDMKRFRALTVNVESFRMHIGDVLNLDAELVAITEHKVSDADVVHVQKDLEERGWQACFQGTRGPDARCGSGGVALMVRQPWRIVQQSHPSIDEWCEEARAIFARVHDGTGKLICYCLATYGFSDKRKHAEEAANLYNALAEVFATFSGEPFILLGDLNEVPGALNGIDRLTACGLAVDAFERADPVTRATPTHIGGRQLDRVYMSTCMASRLRKVEVLEKVFPTHAAVRVEYMRGGDIVPLPRARIVLPFPKKGKVTGQLVNWRVGHGAWQEACDSDDLDAMLGRWTERWETYLVALHGEITTCSGRALDHETNGTSARAPAAAASKALSVEQRQLVNTYNQVCALHRQYVDCEHDDWDEYADWQSKKASVVRRLRKLHDMEVASDDSALIGVKQELQKRVYKEREERRRSQLEEWRTKMQSREHAVRYIKGDQFKQLAFVQHPTSGEIVYDLRDADALLTDFWTKVALPKHATIENIDSEMKNLVATLFPQTEMTSPSLSLTVTALRDRIFGLKNKSAAGPGGWHPTDVKQLPDQALVELLHLFHTCLKQRNTPAAWKQVYVTYLQKKNDWAPKHLRPISVAPLLWRLLSGLIAKRVSGIVEPALERCQCGGRPGMGTGGAISRLKEALDTARRHGRTLHILQLDVEKCFNNLSVPCGLSILQRIGVGEDVVGLLRKHLSETEMRNRFVAGQLGKAWKPPRGLPQGDPMSVALANLILSLIVRKVGLGSPKGKVDAVMYLDDLVLWADDKKDLHAMMTRVLHRLSQLGLSLNDSKCVYCSTVRGDSYTLPTGTVLQAAPTIDMLGCDVVAFATEECNDGRIVDRSKKAVARLQRIAHIPGDMRYRADLAAILAGPLWRYEPFGRPLECATGERDVWDAIHAKQRVPPEEATEVVYAVLTRGHAIYPPWVKLHSAVLSWRRAFTDQPLAKCWSDKTYVDIAHTLLGEIKSFAAELSVHMAGFRMTHAGKGFDLKMLTETIGDFGHRFRGFVRSVLIRQLADRRKEFKGLEDGACTSGKALQWRVERSVAHLHALRRWHTGSYLCRERHWRHSRGQIDPRCMACGETYETVEHIFGCKGWAFPAPPFPVPEVTIRTGLLPRSFSEEGQELDDESWAKFRAWQHAVAGKLVERDVRLSESGPPLRTVKKRLTCKQKPPIAYMHGKVSKVSGTGTRTQGGWNRKTYTADENGAYSYGGHRMVPLGDDRLQCDRCKRTTSRTWLKKFFQCKGPCVGTSA
eukprot:6491332-Amphidinium_carterae.1